MLVSDVAEKPGKQILVKSVIPLCKHSRNSGGIS
jgi:hypothetical protein